VRTVQLACYSGYWLRHSMGPCGALHAPKIGFKTGSCFVPQSGIHGIHFVSAKSTKVRNLTHNQLKNTHGCNINFINLQFSAKSHQSTGNINLKSRPVGAHGISCVLKYRLGNIILISYNGETFQLRTWKFVLFDDINACVRDEWCRSISPLFS